MRSLLSFFHFVNFLCYESVSFFVYFRGSFWAWCVDKAVDVTFFLIDPVLEILDAVLSLNF